MSATAHNRRRREEALKARAYDEAAKAVKGMKKEQLTAMAEEMGLEVAADTKTEELRELVGAAHAKAIAAAERNKQSAGDAVGHDPTQHLPGSDEAAEAEAAAAAEAEAKAKEEAEAAAKAKAEAAAAAAAQGGEGQ